MADVPGIYSRPGTGAPPDNLQRMLTITQPGGETLQHLGIVGDTYTTLISGDDTEGQYCLIDMHIPPDGGPPPHRHDFEELFVMLEGELEVTFRAAKMTIKAGFSANVPSNAPHQFHNVSDKPARVLCLCSPAGQENYFAQVGVPVATRTTAPPADSKAKQIEEMKKIAPEYRTELLQSA